MAATIDTATAAGRLAAHRECWDMPTLAERFPEVIAHLSARYEVHFGMLSDVIVVDKQTYKTEGFATTDVRVAVETLLTREAEAGS